MDYPKLYRRAISWIANNDEDACMSVEAMSEVVSVMLVGDLFDREYLAVAADVIAVRLKQRAT
jgi:hypothetical protein